MEPLDARDIAGMDVRFNRTPLAQDNDIPDITEAGWEQAAVADAPLTRALTDTTPLFANIVLPQEGRYRIFGRFVNNSGSYGPITHLRNLAFSQPPQGTRLIQAWPAWEGRLNNLNVWDLDGQFRLYPTQANIDSTTVDQWNGQEGWPFGPVEGYNLRMTEASTFYETELITLDLATGVEVTPEVEFFAPLNQAIGAQTGYELHCYYALSEFDPIREIPRRAFFRQIPIARNATTEIPECQFLYFRIHLRQWRGAALERFGLQLELQ